MAAISSVFRRLGFVKLEEYGLMLTAEGRVLTTRSAILDDGLGGKIVGWREGDLAAMRLDRWHPLHLGPKITPIPAPIPRVVAPIPRIAAPIPVVVAVVEVDEDEWEWEIAMARARAAAEWAEEAAAAAPSIVKAPPIPARSASIEIAPKQEEWVSALALDDWETPAPKIVVKPVLAVGTGVNAAPTQNVPVTVIPVPSLPRVTDPKLLRPVTTLRPPPHRYPRATGRVDDTVRSSAGFATEGTSPGLAVGASGVKRVAAKQR